MICPQCGSNNTIFKSGKNRCNNCGNTWIPANTGVVTPPKEPSAADPNPQPKKGK